MKAPSGAGCGRSGGRYAATTELSVASRGLLVGIMDDFRAGPEHAGYGIDARPQG